MTDTDRAIRKASARRLLNEMAAAARLVQGIYIPESDRALERHTAWARGYVIGASDYASLTARACLMTAFGK